MNSMASKGVDATSLLLTSHHQQPYLTGTQPKKLFKPMSDEENTLEAIEEQITGLNNATEMPQSYSIIIQHDGSGDEEAEEHMTEYQKFVVQEKCHVLSLALEVAKE
jgi:hypothetical protein